MPLRTAAVLASIAFLVLGAMLPTASSEPAKPKPVCLGKRATIVGTAQANRITGTRRNDVIVGLGGDDTINGAGGVDRVCGGAGFDTCRSAERRSSCEETRPALPRARGARIPAGTFVTDVFRPRLAVTLPDGWYVGTEAESGVLVDLIRGRDPQTDPLLAFDGFSARTALQTAVDQIVAVPEFRTTPRVPATVGGAAGVRFDVTSTADHVFVPGAAAHFFLDTGDRCRIWAVDVRGRTVFVFACVVPRGESLEAFLPAADSVLATIVWLS